MKEKTISVNDLYNGYVLHMHVDEVELENGVKSVREMVNHPGGVCIAALDDEDNICFVKQFRYPYQKEILELPAGKLDKGEEPFKAACRELREETGCEGRDYEFLGDLYPSPGYTDEIIRLYSCRITRRGNLSLDEDEFVEDSYMPLAKAYEMVMNNEIPDAKTQVIILKLANKILKNK